jgi:hypothetical protein
MLASYIFFSAGNIKKETAQGLRLSSLLLGESQHRLRLYADRTAAAALPSTAWRAEALHPLTIFEKKVSQETLILTTKGVNRL